MRWYNNVKIYNGYWKNNSLEGFGCFIQDNNKKYIGYFKDNKKEGIGLNYFYKTNKFILSNWINDKLEGIAIYLSADHESEIWEMKGIELKKDI